MAVGSPSRIRPPDRRNSGSMRVTGRTATTTMPRRIPEDPSGPVSRASPGARLSRSARCGEKAGAEAQGLPAFGERAFVVTCRARAPSPPTDPRRPKAFWSVVCLPSRRALFLSVLPRTGAVTGFAAHRGSRIAALRARLKVMVKPVGAGPARNAVGTMVSGTGPAALSRGRPRGGLGWWARRPERRT